MSASEGPGPARTTTDGAGSFDAAATTDGSGLAERVGVVTQARSTSTRLPGKVLREVAGRTLLEHHLDRLAASGLEVYVATTTGAGDDEIATVAGRRGVPVFRGSEHDVLGRYAGLVREHGLTTVVRVTSDCPLTDGALIREAVAAFLGEDDPRCYLTNTLTRSYPRGFDYEVFSGSLLLEVDEHATEEPQREHVTPYLHQNVPGDVRLLNRPRHADASHLRVTLDTADDLSVITRLITEHDALSLDCEQIIDVLAQHPELAALNAHVEQKKLGE